MDADLQPIDGSVLVVVSTPYHMMASLCLAPSLRRRGARSIDLLVYQNSTGSSERVERLKQCGVFDGIHPMQAGYPEYRHLGSSFILDALFRDAGAKKRFFRLCPSLEGKTFDVLACPCADRASLDAKRFCVPNGRSIFFDDGIGSHDGNVFKTFACFDEGTVKLSVQMSARESLKAALKRFGCSLVGRKSVYRISELHLFAPTTQEIETFRELNVHALELPSDRKLITKVLSNEADAERYRGKQFIFLALPSSVDAETLDCERRLIDCLEHALDGQLYLRLHPRRDPSDFADLQDKILPNSALWESIVMGGYVSGDSVLFSYCSTAQITPKMLCNEEPRLVLLYKLDTVGNLPRSSYESSLEDFRSRYSDSSRVLCPESETELEALVPLL